MKYKIGDKLYCYQNYIGYESDYGESPIFKKSEIYNIFDVDLDNNNNQIIHIKGDNAFDVCIFWTVGTYRLIQNFFYTEKENRLHKLNELEKL